MKLRQLRHVILEPGERFDLRTVYVVGASAVFASIEDPQDPALITTRDVDIALPSDAPVSADRIDFVITTPGTWLARKSGRG